MLVHFASFQLSFLFVFPSQNFLDFSFFGVILSIVMHSIVREVEGDLYILDHELNVDELRIV